MWDTILTFSLSFYVPPILASSSDHTSDIVLLFIREEKTNAKYELQERKVFQLPGIKSNLIPIKTVHLYNSIHCKQLNLLLSVFDSGTVSIVPHCNTQPAKFHEPICCLLFLSCNVGSSGADCFYGSSLIY